MKKFYSLILSLVITMGVAFSVNARPANFTKFDLTKLRYQVDSKSVFSDSRARNIAELSARLDLPTGAMYAAEFENPTPILSFSPAEQVGSIDAPNGETWFYTGTLEYDEIPPHGDVYYTDRILKSWKFEIYDADMKLLGTIKDKMDYASNEVRVPMCELTPVATRNFFNTDDKVELILALAVNLQGGGNNYRSLVYQLDGEVDADGDNVPVDTLDDIVGDVVEGPASADGSDNFYIAFMKDVIEDDSFDFEHSTFWDYLLAQKVSVIVYAKATDSNGPRQIFQKTFPLIQLPGDQENVAPMMSMVHGNDVIYCVSYYKEPFYNQYDDPMSEEMTQRADNSLVVELYQATENEFTLLSTTEIPVALDPMNNADGDPTCIFSFFSVGSLRYTGDILFDAPGASATAPCYIVTRGNYQVSTDGIINSYFVYKADGTLKSTLFTYADGTVEMGDIPGCEPQQMFVSLDQYGYLYNFVNLYSGTTVAQIEADFYYNNHSYGELLSANVARVAAGDSYKYVFEMRYPGNDDNGNDILRFMNLNDKGQYDHIDNVNMGTGVEYAQSYLTTDALAPHAYATSDVPAYMFLVKRRVDNTEVLTEELMVAEIETAENPEGKTLLKLAGDDDGALASIVPEFATEDHPGHLSVYYYNSVASKYSLDVYQLPLSDGSGFTELPSEDSTLSFDNGVILSEGNIKVYAIDGRMAADCAGSFDTATLANGVYVIVADGRAYKIVKK